MKVQRAPQRPRLRQLAPHPERRPHVLLRDACNTRRELKLRGAHHLRVDAADVPDDVDEPLHRCSLVEVAPGEPTRANLVPGE